MNTGRRRNKAKDEGSVLALRVRFRRLPQRFDDVQTALSLSSAGPAPRPRIFAGLDCSRAMSAADAGIILIMERVVRHVVFEEITPHLLRSPVGNRIQLHQSEFLVPLDFASVHPK